MDAKVIAQIRRENPHWEGRPWPGMAGAIPREVMSDLQADLGHRLMISLVGLRRAGKTTLLRQVAAELLRRGAAAESILYFPFDEVVGAKPGVLDDVLSYYEEQVLGRAFTDSPARVHILLDEVHFVPGWSSVLKHRYDSGADLKFLLAASVSTLLARKSRESLAGRILEREVPPFSFSEVCASRSVRVHRWDALKTSPEALRRAFQASAGGSAKLRALAPDYLLRGGFPELVKTPDPEFHRRYLRESVIDRLIYADLPLTFTVKSPEAALRLLGHVAGNPGMMVDFATLAGPLGIDQRTVADYLTYLERAFLVHRVPNRTRSAGRAFRTLKKFYPSDVGIAAVFGGWSFAAPPDPPTVGHLAETAVLLHLRRSGPVSFFRDKAGHEADFIIERPEGPVLIESKYQHASIRTDDVERLMERLGVSAAYIVSRDEHRISTGPEGRPLSVVPLWWFLLSDWSGRRSDTPPGRPPRPRRLARTGSRK